MSKFKKVIKIILGMPCVLVMWIPGLLWYIIRALKYYEYFLNKEIRAVLLEGLLYSATLPYQFVKAVWNDEI